MNSHRATRIRPLVFATLGIALVLAGSAPAEETRDPRAIAVLEEAAQALRSMPSVRYDFEYGHRDDPTGWVSGRVTLRRVTDPGDSWARVDGTIHAQPAFRVSETRFEYAVDGERAWSVDHTARTYETAPVGAGANRLSWNAVFGILPEFVEAEPLWKELGALPQAVELLAPEKVGGVLCDVVRVSFRFPETQAVNTWYLARDDRLPRRLRWSSGVPGSPDLVLAISDPKVADVRREEFRLSAPPGYQADDAAEIAGLGRQVPNWTLKAADGTEVSLRELRGRVVVMDFWNTWCYLCHTLLPQSKTLWREFESQGVRFFGVNVFEAEEADPAAFWRREAFPYPLLLAGEEVAGALDLPWQPAVAVIGADGKLLYAQLGASHDRADKVRQAIRRGLVEERVGRSR